MCTRMTCRACGKPTYSGCGAHVESVLRDVPKDQRCRCREDGVPGGGPRRVKWWPFS